MYELRERERDCHYHANIKVITLYHIPKYRMVSCGFARTAIRKIAQKNELQKGNKCSRYPQGSMKALWHEYTDLFKQYPAMHKPYNTAAKKIPTILQTFRKHWKGSNDFELYLASFSTEAWAKLSEEEKLSHTVKDCGACDKNHHNVCILHPTKQ